MRSGLRDSFPRVFRPSRRRILLSLLLVLNLLMPMAAEADIFPTAPTVNEGNVWGHTVPGNSALPEKAGSALPPEVSGMSGSGGTESEVLPPAPNPINGPGYAYGPGYAGVPAGGNYYGYDGNYGYAGSYPNGYDYGYSSDSYGYDDTYHYNGGFTYGYDDTYPYSNGYGNGFQQGYGSGYSTGYGTGYDSGFSSGYGSGYQAGYTSGYNLSIGPDYNGASIVEVNRNAVTKLRGCNLRSTIDLSGNYNILRKVHGHVSVFVLKYTFDIYGRKWYYLRLNDGLEGWAAASLIKLK